MESVKTTALKPEPAAGRSRLKYEQVRDHLYAGIRTGRLIPGQSLPTEAKLVESLGMSRHTIRQALAELEGDGLIERVRGRGTFVSTKQQQAQVRQQQLDAFSLIVPQVREGLYPSLVDGFQQACAAVHQQVLICSSGGEVSRQGDLVLQMIDRSAGGVAMVPSTTTTTPAYQVRQLQQHQIPVVFCHRTVEGISAPCVTWCGREVGRTAGKMLVEHGHRRICILRGPHRSSLGDDYEAGLLEATKEVDAEISTVQYTGTGGAREGVPQAIRLSLTDLFSRTPRPTAIFCGNVPDAEQVYTQAQDFGLKVPQDLSVIAFGGTWRSHGLAEKISCVAVDEHAVGHKAAEILHEMRGGRRAIDNDERIEFPIEEYVGGTLGSVP